MWYWVKNPKTGNEVDYNHTELKTAVINGEAALDWEARRHTEKKYHTVNQLLEIGDDDETHDEKSNFKQEISFLCVACHSSLRIQAPSGNETYRCPKCAVIYKTIQAGKSPIVFVLKPQVAKNNGESSGQPNQRTRSIPPEVTRALKVFGLNESATLSDIKSAYREQIKAYHPDKVSHLGAELRAVAEAKTKEFNSAIKILTNFYPT